MEGVVGRRKVVPINLVFLMRLKFDSHVRY